MRFAARFVFSFILFSLVFLGGFSSHVFAAAQMQTQTSSFTNTEPNVPTTMHSYTQVAISELMSALYCQLIGTDPMSANGDCLGYNLSTGKFGYLPHQTNKGAIGFMGNAIAQLYNIPVHTGDYFAYAGQKFGFTKAYAADAGVGFNGIKPMVNIWVAFRNVTYLVAVFIFVIVGLAIMLRIKIDPRTVMGIENQIPKLIIGLILITFSFAIAGFLIDMMYVLMSFMTSVITSIPGTVLTGINLGNFENTTTLQASNYINGSHGLGIVGFVSTVAGYGKDIMLSLLGIDPNPFAHLAGLDLGALVQGKGVGGLFQSFTNPGSHVFDSLIDLASLWPALKLAGAWAPITASPIPGTGLIGAGVGFYVGNLLGETTGRQVLPYMIVWLILMVAVLHTLIKLWFTLLKAYILILLDVVFGPLLIALGLFPGAPGGFLDWFRGLAANLVAFPVTIGMFLLGRIFVDLFDTTHAQVFVPPLIGNPGGGSGAASVGALIGIGFIFLTPEVVNMMREMLKVKKNNFGASVGAAVGVATGAPKGAFNMASMVGSSLFSFAHIPGIQNIPIPFAPKGTTIGSIGGGMMPPHGRGPGG
ncbi:MAG: hypothetical protein ACREGI_05995 [Candidatus Levyibacteriota bacterium]